MWMVILQMSVPAETHLRKLNTRIRVADCPFPVQKRSTQWVIQGNPPGEQERSTQWVTQGNPPGEQDLIHHKRASHWILKLPVHWVL